MIYMPSSLPASIQSAEPLAPVARLKKAKQMNFFSIVEKLSIKVPKLFPLHPPHVWLHARLARQNHPNIH
jgi:hypothetical protein